MNENKEKIIEKGGFIVMVEQFAKHPDILRITTYVGKEKITSPEQLDKNNTDTMYSFWKETDGECWIDFDRPELKDPTAIEHFMEGAHPTQDWKLFEKVLWAKKENGDKGIVWDQTNVDRLLGKWDPCSQCDIVDEGVKKIMEYSKQAIEELKKSSGKDTKNAGLVISIVSSWQLLKDRCQRCLEIEKSICKQFEKFGQETKK